MSAHTHANTQIAHKVLLLIYECVQVECRAPAESFSSLQRVRVALDEHGVWVLHCLIIPCLQEFECGGSSRDFWELVAAVLHTAIAGKVGHRYGICTCTKICNLWEMSMRMRLCLYDM